MSIPDDGLTKWVRRAVADITNAGTFCKYALVHAVEGEGFSPIEAWHPDQPEPDELSALIWESAEREVETRPSGSRQRYVVLAFRADRNGDPKIEAENTFAFVLHGRSNATHSYGSDTDAPTVTGERAMYNRHTNDMHRIMMIQTDSTAMRSIREIERLEAKVLRYEEQNDKLRRITDELMDRKLERELHMQRETQKAKHVEALIGMLMSLAPTILSTIAGAKGMPVGVTAALRDQGVEKILSSLTQHQIEHIAQGLSPEQTLAFLELYKSYQQADSKKQSEKPPLLQERTNEEAKH